MLFSSITFLYAFLPAVLLLYFIVPFKLKNIVLLVFSLFFYFWGEPIYLFLMIGTSLSGYLHGLLIDKYRGTVKSKAFLISSIVISLALLGVFKYSDFFVDNLNALLGDNYSIMSPMLMLPIGISFYTFQVLSYTIDLYRGEAKVQKSFINFTTYVSLFPQLIAGPIVRYTTVADELDKRVHSFESFAYGVRRFIVGLGKKVLIANLLGEVCSTYKATSEPSVLFLWVYVISFSLQIYFDFSGYSDMAIGLGRMFGFHFLENFDFPYISKSITEFWRRWHISLGTWFRDYLYIPLGGNRVSRIKWVRNLLIVWFLTGFWHGAGWNFIIWGLMFGVLLIFEKLFLSKIIDKLPAFISRIYVLLMVMISWVFFDAESLAVALSRVVSMFGFGSMPPYNPEAVYYFRNYAVVMVIGIIGATPIVKNIVTKLKNKYPKTINILEPIFVVTTFLLVTACHVDGSFNPFLYFRF